MTSSSPRHVDGTSRQAEWSPLDAQRSTGAIRTREVEMRESLAAAARERAELQSRIVRAFRDHLDGDGPGPSEQDLMLFAQTAVKEWRLASRFAATRPPLVARRR
ncbi:hypothetical protein WKW79_03555 [Variovorax robiniae]|uniref:Uncharacterized protein n=1 Tax=Variovorax robiniae TaxID=1836199 RepID=A0ABU8X1L9_9BURK